ncbi:MAG: hypothetical protein ACI9U2_001404 [Bradymonadia bacterium]|jgi:hypothetical protein
MAQLRHLQSDRLWSLSESSQLGRRPNSWIPLTAPCTSGRHAQIIYSGGRWLIVDLGSRNGTRLQNQSVSAIARPLSSGQRIALGSDAGEVFEVVHVDPPEPIAMVPSDPTQRVVGEDGVLCLHDGDRTVLVREQTGRWLMQCDDAEPVEVVTGHVIKRGAVQWTLVLPSHHTVTLEAQASETTTLVIQHSQDLDDFEFAIRRTGHPSRSLGARTYSFMLYVLAQRLLTEQTDPDIAAAEAGWMRVPDLLDELTRANGIEAERTHINMHVLRFRKVIERFASRAPDIPRIERRGDSDRIRLAGPVLIEPLGGCGA